MSVERGWAEALFVRENRDYLDWWLMQKFPGRTLEELDGLDWLRLRRALEVGRVVDIEARRALNQEGKLPPENITADDWRAITRHDALFAQWEAEHAATRRLAHGGAVDGEQHEQGRPGQIAE